MKKRNLVFLLLCFLLLATSCGKNKEQKSEKEINNVLYEQGVEVIRLMDMMINSEAYGTMRVGGDTLKQVLESLQTGDYTKPKQVYELELYRDYISYLLDSKDAKMQNLPEELQSYVKQSGRCQLASLLNKRFISEQAQLASNTYEASTTFVCKGLESDKTFLYLFDVGYPILVSYVVGQDGTVTAVGQFLFTEGLKVDNKEALKERLQAEFLVGDITVKEVQYSGKE